MREEKSWWTEKRLARGPQAADEEIRRWAQSAFRRAQLRGSLQDMRARALAERAKATEGRPAREFPTGWVLAGVGAAAALAWWLHKRKGAQPDAQRKASAQAYLDGTAVLAACA